MIVFICAGEYAKLFGKDNLNINNGNWRQAGDTIREASAIFNLIFLRLVKIAIEVNLTVYFYKKLNYVILKHSVHFLYVFYYEYI